MKKKMLFVIVLVFLSHVLVYSQQKGKLVRTFIDAPSLANSIIGEPVKQPLAIYLPPSYYSETQKRYPVVYFLIGFSDTLGDFVRGNNAYIPGYIFENSMNSNITQGRIKEVIMVIVNGYNVLQGSFYFNSPITGNWEDFVVKDVVGYIDKTYRTISKPGSRAILGTSMGGYGSLHLAMKHPSVFSVGLGYCPGLADEVGIMRTAMFIDNAVIKNVIALRNELAKYPRETAHQKYLESIKNYIKSNDFPMLFSLAYGSAFAPDTSLNAPYFKYPYSLENDKLVKDTAIFKLYENGFGNLKRKIEIYKDSLLKLKAYVIDYGSGDGNTWIQDGSKYFDKQLTTAGIPHRLMVNGGGHGNWLKNRTENYQLPYCDSLLAFDTNHLSSKSNIEKYIIKDQEKEPVIDTVNRKITVFLKSTAKITKIYPTIYFSSGAKAIPFQNTGLLPYVDFSTNSFEYTVIAEDGKNSSKWTVNASISTGMQNPSEQKNRLQIYPNPAHNHIFLSADGNNINKVEIIDMMGQLVFKKSTNNQNVLIEQNNICPGTYIIKAFTNKNCFTGTLIIR